MLEITSESNRMINGRGWMGGLPMRMGLQPEAFALVEMLATPTPRVLVIVGFV